MSRKEDFKKYLIKWNNTFPYDRWYRKKYNIGFNSKEHRALCQIDIMLDFLEDELIEESKVRFKERERKRKALEEGKWLADLGDTLTEKERQKLSDEINLDDFDNIQFDYGKPSTSNNIISNKEENG